MKIVIEVDVPNGESCFQCNYFDNSCEEMNVDYCWLFREFVVEKCDDCLTACEKALQGDDVAKE